jgi:CO/xanthine dehydrogenase Mo-binding subunit
VQACRQLMDLRVKSLQGFGVPAASCGLAKKRLAWVTVAPRLDPASPLRPAHLRDPVGPQVAAARANAVFDATGVRLRRVPLTPQRLNPALA